MEALAEYDPTPGLTFVPLGTPLPMHFQMVERKTPGGAAFYGAPMDVGAPLPSPFYRATGFEIGLALSTTLTIDDMWSELERLIRDHDKPEIEWLLITVASLDRYGSTYLSEHLVWEIIHENLRDLVPPKHLRRITVHDDSKGSAFDLFPHHEAVFGPILQERLVLMQPLVALPPDASSPPESSQSSSPA